MRIKRRMYFYHLLRDIFIVVGSIAAAYFLMKAGAIEKFLEATSSFKLVASFVAGMFFTTVFTVAPATVALIAIAKSLPAIYVALLGGVGAMIVDAVIFRFFRDKVASDASGVLNKSSKKWLRALFRHGFLKWLLVILGGVIIASPLPDELGLALISVSKIKNSVLFPLLFIMNFLGILAIVSLADLII
ncbi:MAG: hypothetical protein UX94_C0011G0019 [Parcubacteria group bacterium GW2011_GWA2_47_21]|nr:MAG: hypothetical protein UX94_C0011G0019 [Parcubacteria group bacterium GW2011_GWA2_47_21]